MPYRISGPSEPIDVASLFNGVGTIHQQREAGQAPSSTGNADDLRKACSEFESLFIFHLLKEMRSTIPKTGLLSGGRGEAMYTSMFDAEVAREMASQRGMGLSEFLMARLGTKKGAEEKNQAENEKKAKVLNPDNR